MRLKRLWGIAENRKKAVNVGLTVITVLILFGIYVRYAPFVFSTNDDLFMKSILSGEITGKPEYRGVYLGVPAGLLISTMYRIFPTVPWYGFFLCICQMAAMSAVLYKCIQASDKIRVKGMIAAAFALVSSGVQLQHFVSIQFTVVAGITGAAAIFWFYATECKGNAADFVKANIPALLLLALAFSIRREAVFMLLPMAVMLWIAKWLVEETPFRKKTVLSYAGVLGSAVVLVGLLMMAEWLAYAGEDWQTYRKYNDSRGRIYDYYGYPDYEKNQQTYEELGITYASYVGASTRYCVLLDDNINADSMEKLAELAERERAVYAAVLLLALAYRLFWVKQKVILWLLGAGFLLLTVRYGWQKAEAYKGENMGRLFTSSAYLQWKEYCTAHPEAFYLMDTESVEHYTEDILARQEYSYLNSAMLGSWLAKSPLYEEKLRDRGIDNVEEALLDSENVYAVFTDTKGLEPDYLYDYYEEKYPGCRFETVDTYQADNGTVFLIMKGIRIRKE